MANRLNWSLGHEGKGNVYPNEDISTWNIDESGSPHHEEEAAQENQDFPVFKFYISPEGGIHDGGLGFENHTPYTDDQVIERIANEGNALFDARDKGHEDLEAEPRVEMPGGGYGHAYNLLEMMSKLGVAKEDGWADFHTELKLPRGVRRKIRDWVNRLNWPEGSEQEDARRYHITILSMDEYDDDFADWAREQIRGKVFSFKTTGIEIFGGEHVVLRVECPEWTDLVLHWQEKAEREGLEPRKFDPPKAHITVGKSPEGKWPQGIPDPHLEFDTRMFNINKNAATPPRYMYHYSPPGNEDSIAQHGLHVRHPETGQSYAEETSDEGMAPGSTQPGVYMFGWPDEALQHAQESWPPGSVWKVDTQGLPVVQDPFHTRLDPETNIWVHHGHIPPARLERMEVPPHPDLTPEELQEWNEHFAAVNPQRWRDAFDKELGRDHSPTTEMMAVDDLWPYREYERELPYDDDGPAGQYARDLRDHIQQHGIRSPLKLEYYPQHGIASLGEGNHRLQIAKQLGITHVPVEVLTTGSSKVPFNSLGGAPVPSQVEADQFGYIPSNLKPSQLGLRTAAKVAINNLPGPGEQPLWSNPALELQKWLDSFSPKEESQPLSIHHTDEAQIAPQTRSPAVSEPHIDPPSHPYKPYNWAEESFETSPLDRTAAADPNWLQAWIAKNGPYAFHYTYPELKDQVLTNGIIPWDAPIKDAPGSIWESDHLQPRPGHTYLTVVPWDAIKSYDPMKSAQAVIDLRKLDPSRLNPDEDAADKNPGWGVLPGYDNLYPEESNINYPLGQWAEDRDLRHPQMVADSMNREGTVAHRGTIPPEAIVDWREPDSTPNMSWEPSYWKGPKQPVYRGQDSEIPGVTASLDVCPNCGDEDGTPCKQCGYDELQLGSDYEKAKRHWYDTAWDEPGSPRPFPPQPEHWRKDHATDVKFAAMTKQRRLDLMDYEDRAHGPDTSVPEYQFPDGWTMNRLETYGDMLREGNLMSNCFSPSMTEVPHKLWHEHPKTEYFQDGHTDGGWIDRYEVPEEAYLTPEDLQEPLSYSLYSLRDPDNYPHVSFDPGGEHLESVFGAHNSEPKPEYMARVHQWAQQHEDPDIYMNADEEFHPSRFIRSANDHLDNAAGRHIGSERAGQPVDDLLGVRARESGAGGSNRAAHNGDYMRGMRRDLSGASTSVGGWREIS